VRSFKQRCGNVLLNCTVDVALALGYEDWAEPLSSIEPGVESTSIGWGLQWIVSLINVPRKGRSR